MNLRIATGICALYVTLQGVLNLYGLDFRIDTLVSVLYCLLPFCSFFVFSLVRRPNIALTVHTIVAVGYLAEFSMLNWRTCTAYGYCDTQLSTVLMTLRTKPVLAAFAVIVLSVIAGAVQKDRNRKPTAA